MGAEPQYATIGLFLRCAIRATQMACAVYDITHAHVRVEQDPSLTKF